LLLVVCDFLLVVVFVCEFVVVMNTDGLRRVLITGANRGIGLFLTQHILRGHPDVFVFLGARSKEKGKGALETLPSEHLGRVEVLEIDVGNDSSVKNAAKEIETKFPDEKHPLFGLVNNAGVNGVDTKQTMNINVFGVERTTTAFAPLLVPDARRVVNVTSGAGVLFTESCSPERQKFFLNQTGEPVTVTSITNFIETEIYPISEVGRVGDEEERKFAEKGLGKNNGKLMYGLSKALGNLLTIELSLRFPSLLVNACTPGLVETDMTRDMISKSGKTKEELEVVPREKSTHSSLFLLFGDVKERGCFFRSDGVKCAMNKY